MTRTFAAIALAIAATGPLQAQDSSARRFVLIGCVSQENAKSPLVITDRRRDPPLVYRLDGDPKQLSMLVGQTVEVTGPITSAPKQPPTLKVTSLARIATSCAKGK